MKALLALSRLIDALTERVGQLTYWLILVAVVISTGNAIIRYAFSISSNAWLELQWYLFSAVFLFCAGYALLHNQHVRIDVVSSHFGRRARAWIDILGTLFFLLPMAITIMWLSWPVFVDAYTHNEVSTNAGGLVIWPARLMIPIGFLLLVLQGLSEMIKRIAFLLGMIPDPSEKDAGPSAEEELAAEIRRLRGGSDMTAFVVANMAPLMFGALIVFLLAGYPVAFALAANGIFFGLIGVELGMLEPSLFQALPQRIWAVMSNDTLLAVPFFTFMGLILERSGMAEDLLDTIGQLFGPLRGGLAIAVICVGALLAATTGVVAASVISMGLISLPIMLRYGYDRRFASGVIAASGTLAQIIPPSLVLIVLADQLGKSVGDMYAGAFIPGLTLAGFYVLYAVGVAVFKPAWAPALPVEARVFREPNGSSGTPSLIVLFIVSTVASVAFAKYYFPAPDAPVDEMLVVSTSVGVAVAFFASVLNYLFKLGLLSRMAERVTFVLIPPLALIFLVLGTIFLGVATPTEGGAMGASGALVMAIARRRLSFPLIRQAMDSTAKLTAFVVFILVGARVFSLTFYGVDGHIWVEHLLTGLPGGQLGFLIVVNLLVFVLAFFLDFFELAFIIVPLLGPVAEKLGIDLIWFGILLGVNMQTSFMHPPFGFALFYLRSVAPAKDFIDRVSGKLTPRVTTGQIYWGAVPFVIIQCLMVGLIIAFPNLVTGGLTKKQAVNTDQMRIEVPDEIPNPDAAQSPGGAAADDDDPTKALERAMGEEDKQPPADASKAEPKAEGKP